MTGIPAWHREAPPRRPIRSFVRRQGRLTVAQERAFVQLWPRYGVDWTPGTRLDPVALFGQERPCHLEIGFGNGEALAEMAASHPQRHYLGVEVHGPGVGHLLLEIHRRGLSNLRLLREDAVPLLAEGLPPASLTGVCLFFPDPWPKKRHHKRRLLTPEFAADLVRVLHSGGLFQAATDWEEYAGQMLGILEAEARLINAAGPGAFAPGPLERSPTRFERRGRRLGHDIYELQFYRR